MLYLKVVIINGALFYMDHEAFRRKREIPSYGSAPAIGWTAVFLTLYTGNMYYAAELAGHASQDSRKDLLRRLTALGYYELLDRN